MSKKIDVELRCPSCRDIFPATLYRSIWIEEPELRSMLFDDLVNRKECPSCGEEFEVPFSLLATNAKLKFAVWYEPNPDSAIDNDIIGYASTVGPDHYLSSAPRMPTWLEFKKYIWMLENGANLTFESGVGGASQVPRLDSIEIAHLIVGARVVTRQQVMSEHPELKNSQSWSKLNELYQERYSAELLRIAMEFDRDNFIAIMNAYQNESWMQELDEATYLGEDPNVPNRTERIGYILELCKRSKDAMSWDDVRPTHLW